MVRISIVSASWSQPRWKPLHHHKTQNAIWTPVPHLAAWALRELRTLSPHAAVHWAWAQQMSFLDVRF
jgi:hypothetical protein